MKRWQLYFKTDHLPPHLRRISEPFGVLAKAIVEAGDTDGIDELFAACWAAVDGKVVDDEQETRMDLELRNARETGNGYRDWQNDALSKVLSAKDCAVRACLPDPVTP